jgi:hypothetical protein
MGNSIINVADEKRAEYGCSLINKAARLGLLTTGIVQAPTTGGLQELLDAIRAVADSKAFNPANRFIFEALVRELKWLNGLDILSDTIVNNLLTVNTASAATDLKYNFSSLVNNPNFDPAREDYVCEASGATSY